MFDISIIIPVYKSKSTLKASINSVIDQKFTNFIPKIEIILSIDDCKSYKDLNLTKNKNISIKFIYTKKYKSGPGNARNVGYKYSSGKLIGFLDSDDMYSKNYLNEMMNHIHKEKILTSGTHIYKNFVKIDEFKGKNNFLNLDELIEYPCSFHPFMKRELFQKYETKHSQDIYNLTKFLNKKKIKVIKNAYYILNLRDKSLTRGKYFQHELKQAYKYYLIKAIKEKERKISQHFAKRIILNQHYYEWINKNKQKNTSYYEYIRKMRCI